MAKSIRLDFFCTDGKITLTIMKRADHLHQVVGMNIVHATMNIQAMAPCGNTLDVRPVMLADLHRASSQFGKLVARLIQSEAVADGKTDHYDLVHGRMTAFVPVAA